METESHYAFIIWKRATWTFFKTSPLVFLRRKVITLRWLNNDKMFISGYTVPLSLSLGNIFSLYTIRCRERFPFVFSSQLSLVRPLCVRSTHYLNVNYSACVSPSNPAGHFWSCAGGHFGSLSPALNCDPPFWESDWTFTSVNHRRWITAYWKREMKFQSRKTDSSWEI